MRYIVIGCGRTGAGLAAQLDAAGHHVTVVDIDAAAFGRLRPGFGGETICGMGFDREVLARADISHADGLAVVTGNDEVNAVTARLASRTFRVPKVVARLHDPLKAEIYRRLGVQVIAPVDWSIHRAADLLTFAQASVVVSLGSGHVDMVDADASPLLEGRTASEVNVPGEVLLVAVTRSGRTFVATSTTTLQGGDILHFAVVGASRGRLEALLGAR